MLLGIIYIRNELLSFMFNKYGQVLLRRITYYNFKACSHVGTCRIIIIIVVKKKIK